MNSPRFFSALPLALLFALLLGLVGLRAGLVDDNIGTYIACPGCFHSAVFSADLVLFSLVSALLLLAGFLRPDLLSRLVQSLSGLLVLIYIADLIVFSLFNSRLFMSDAALFFAEGSAVWDQLSSGLGGTVITLLLLLAVAGMFVLLYLMRPMRSRRKRVILAAVLGLSLTAGALLGQQPYVNDWAVDNVFAANLATSERTLYSDAGAEKILAARKPAVMLAGGPAAAGTNVVIILLESWSSWHSALFEGYADWTPQMDSAALRGLRYSNFHSIGFSTDKGLVGILAGQQVWAPFLHWFETPPFHSMWGVGRTLPAVFAGQDYLTAFLTTGPLSLYRKGEWLTDLGFGHVEGNEHPFYADWPRFSFRSASDRALYQRAAQWQAEASSPYLLVLETVTTHQPYRDPDTRQRSLELAMKYADREFGAYLEQLDQSGYFDDGGILMVVSDHRSMTPIPAQELERFGPAAHSRVPAFIIGLGFAPAGVKDAVFSHSDLVPSFEWWLSGQADLQPHDALMFGQDNQAGKCAFHSRGDQRGVIEVTCTSGRGQVKIDGDRTHFANSEGLDQATMDDVLTVIGIERLEGLQRHQETL